MKAKYAGSREGGRVSQKALHLPTTHAYEQVLQGSLCPKVLNIKTVSFKVMSVYGFVLYLVNNTYQLM